MSLKSSIKWAKKNLHSLTSKALGKDNMDAKIPSFNSEVLILDEQIIHIKTKFLPAMVKKKKCPVIEYANWKGRFDLQSKQDYYTARQKLFLNQLIKQKASFEHVQSSHETELRKH